MRNIKFILSALVITMLMAGCSNNAAVSSPAANTQDAGSSYSESSYEENSNDEYTAESSEDYEPEIQSPAAADSSVYEYAEESSENYESSVYSYEEYEPSENSVLYDSQDTGTEMTAEELKADLDSIFLEQNLKAVDTMLIDTYGKDYVREYFVYFDCEEDRTIMLEANWTIKKWTISNGKFYLGCAKTAKGLDSLNNALDTLLNSRGYQAVSKIADIVDTAQTLGIIDDD